MTLSTADNARVLRDLSISLFENAAFAMMVPSLALLAGFVAYGAVQLRRGLADGANFLSWSAAVVLWGVAVIRSRGALVDAQTARYTYLAVGFALLAIVPRQPLGLAERFPVLAGRPGRWMSAAVIVLLAGLRAADVRGDLEAEAANQERLALEARGTMLVVDMAPESVPDDTPIEFFGNFRRGTASDLRALIVRYGPERSPADGTVEERLVDLEIVQAEPGRQLRGACDAQPQPMRLDPGRARIWSGSDYSVDVRRYGEEWARLADGTAGQVLILTLPQLHSTKPWEVRADGACLLDP